jgi:hypothetical protein
VTFEFAISVDEFYAVVPFKFAIFVAEFSDVVPFKFAIFVADSFAVPPFKFAIFVADSFAVVPFKSNMSRVSFAFLFASEAYSSAAFSSDCTFSCDFCDNRRSSDVTFVTPVVEPSFRLGIAFWIDTPTFFPADCAFSCDFCDFRDICRASNETPSSEFLELEIEVEPFVDIIFPFKKEHARAFYGRTKSSQGKFCNSIFEARV